MNAIVKGSLALGALLVVSAGVVGGLRSGDAAPTGAPAAPPTSPEGQARPALTIAAASDLKFALDELLGAFRAEHPGADIQVTYGSSGNFLAQLSQGAPFDVFLSADVAYPRKLVEQGLVEGEVFLYGVGRLVVWAPKRSAVPLEAEGLRALLSPSARKVAIANPQHAPYGRAAEAALKSQGLYADVKERLVLGENIAQTAQFVQSGAADVGLIALALALAPAMQAEGHYVEVPLGAYPSMEQGGALMKKARDPALARAFRDKLLSADGKALLRRYGFFLPGE